MIVGITRGVFDACRIDGQQRRHVGRQNAVGKENPDNRIGRINVVGHGSNGPNVRGKCNRVNHPVINRLVEGRREPIDKSVSGCIFGNYG